LVVVTSPCENEPSTRIERDVDARRASCSASHRIFHASIRRVVIWSTGGAPNPGSRSCCEEKSNRAAA
jgi:hypothetical protein